MLENNDLALKALRSLRNVGLELKRKTPDLMDFLESRNVDVVVDVGANTGQFGSRLRRLGYHGRIVSFEPLSGVFSQLKTLTDSDSNWTSYNCALGEEPGRASINVSQNTVYSSLLPQEAGTVAFDAASVVERTEDIEVRTLDQMAAEIGGKNVFLKIDTQGFEKHVMDGARSSLRTIAGVQLELPIVHLYQQTWTLVEAINYMANAGFILSQVAPVTYLGDDPVSLLEIDGVFRRA